MKIIEKSGLVFITKGLLRKRVYVYVPSQDNSQHFMIPLTEVIYEKSEKKQ